MDDEIGLRKALPDKREVPGAERPSQRSRTDQLREVRIVL